jgi:hypothetical protein
MSVGQCQLNHIFSGICTTDYQVRDDFENHAIGLKVDIHSGRDDLVEHRLPGDVRQNEKKIMR